MFLLLGGLASGGLLRRGPALEHAHLAEDHADGKFGQWQDSRAGKHLAQFAEKFGPLFLIANLPFEEIHVGGPEAVEDARAAAAFVDALLGLDAR